MSDNKSTSRSREYRNHIKGYPESKIINIALDVIKKGHEKQNLSGKEYARVVASVAKTPVVQKMKTFNHHSHTNCYEHSVHVSYYNWLICKKLGWDSKEAAKAGLLHDLFLYDWHGRKVPEGERMHGFEHPSTALKNAGKNFNLTEKEGDIIVKHMFPLTITPPKYKESYVIVMTDKFCSVCEVMDRFFKKEKRDTFRRKSRG